MRSRKPKAIANSRSSRRRVAARGGLSRAAAERIADRGYQKLLEEGFSKDIAEQYRRETIVDLMKPIGS